MLGILANVCQVHTQGEERAKVLPRRKCRRVSRASRDARQMVAGGQQEPVQDVGAAVVLVNAGWVL